MLVPSLMLTGAAVAALATLTGTQAACPEPAPPTMSVVDGFVVGHLPAGVGTQTSTHDYEWEDVTFHSLVWERGPDAEGAFAVDLMVKTLRGAQLVDLAATREFLAGYHEQDPAAWTAFDVGGNPGYRRPGAVFWWVEPGLAVEVGLDGSRFPDSEVVATTLGIRPE